MVILSHSPVLILDPLGFDRNFACSTSKLSNLRLIFFLLNFHKIQALKIQKLSYFKSKWEDFFFFKSHKIRRETKQFHIAFFSEHISNFYAIYYITVHFQFTLQPNTHFNSNIQNSNSNHCFWWTLIFLSSFSVPCGTWSIWIWSSQVVQRPQEENEHRQHRKYLWGFHWMDCLTHNVLCSLWHLGRHCWWVIGLWRRFHSWPSSPWDWCYPTCKSFESEPFWSAFSLAKI